MMTAIAVAQLLKQKAITASNFQTQGDIMGRWISMIRQPEFVTEEVFEAAKDSLKKLFYHIIFFISSITSERLSHLA